MLGYKKVTYRGDDIRGNDVYSADFDPITFQLNCTMAIPRGFETHIGIGHHYIYPDNSSFYFARESDGENKENIRIMGDSIYKIRFQNRGLVKSINEELGREVIIIRPDTLELSGMDADSLYWKDIVIHDICAGYNGVPLKNKEKFDKCLKTFRMDIIKRRYRRPLFW